MWWRNSLRFGRYDHFTGVAPAITSADTADVATGDTAVITVTATGSPTVVFSINGGTDASLFTIDQITGDLSFKDDSVDGDYSVRVAASNPYGIATQTITVTVVASGYTAHAVHFDGSTSLSIASLTASNSGKMSFVLWFKLNGTQLDSFTPFFVVDPENADAINAFPSPTASLGIDYQGTGGTGLSKIKTQSADNALPADTWGCIISAADSATGVSKSYLGDVDITGNVFASDTGFTMAFSGKSFWVNSDSFGDMFTGDFADMRFMPGTSLLDGGGDIPLATRRLFIDDDGKPVDPATATASLGAPVILFSGNATNFATNQGTGGAFTLTGSLTNASSSPSD